MSSCNYKAKAKLLKALLTFLPPEPDFSYLDALAPYQPLAMKCVYCPIDTRLNFHQVSKLLKEVQVHFFFCNVTIPFVNMLNVLLALFLNQLQKQAEVSGEQIAPT